jgi:raffinose/stachyose/melibiose transport system permease protein
MTNVFFDWVNSSDMALYALIIVTVWQMAGYIMIIYITGLQSIPEEFLEAANIDGASFWQTMFKIKVPLLMPSFTICLFISLANCFKMYDINFSLTGGGPASSSELVAMNIYNEIFSRSNFGYGQAKAILFFFVIAAVTMVQVYITKKREVTL